MFDNVDILRHGRETKHAFIRKERARSYRTVVGPTLFEAETPSYVFHVSPIMSSERHESYTNFPNALKVQLDISAPDVYPRGPLDTSMLYLLQIMLPNTCGTKK